MWYHTDMDYTKAPGTAEQINALLLRLAPRYIWWKSPEEAVEKPERVIAQIMDIGDFDDMQTMAALVGDDILRDVLIHAEAGQFNPRSWHYWHYRLGLARYGEIPVPPMPVRRVE